MLCDVFSIQILKPYTMSKKPNHSADIKNANIGTKGTNVTYDKAQGARGKHLNPNQTKNK